MATSDKTVITVSATIFAPIEKVWDYWTDPQHIMQWNNASGDWHTVKAENDLQVGGKFHSRMEAKDGSMGFDFNGVYSIVDPYNHIAYTLEDGRLVDIYYKEKNGSTEINESFEAENENSVELQWAGWQAILNNFKKYTES
jgi:uncharacterized protein YndB with AHSA1/START domain